MGTGIQEGKAPHTVDLAMSHVWMYLGPLGVTFPRPHQGPSAVANEGSSSRVVTEVSIMPRAAAANAATTINAALQASGGQR
jgi:hypothetical protein